MQTRPVQRLYKTINKLYIYEDVFLKLVSTHINSWTFFFHNPTFVPSLSNLSHHYFCLPLWHRLLVKLQLFVAFMPINIILRKPFAKT